MTEEKAPSKSPEKIVGIIAVIYLVILTVFHISYPLIVSIDAPSAGRRTDLVSFITGAKIILNGQGKNIYNVDTQKEFQQEVTKPTKNKNLLPFRSPAVVALFYTPFAGLYPEQRYLAVLITNLLITVINTVMLGKLFPKVEKLKFWFLIPFASFSVFWNLQLGQVLPLFLLLNILSYYKLKQGRDISSGLLAGMVMIKPQYILLPYAFFLRASNKFKFILGFTITVAAFTLLNLYITGPSALREYPRFLMSTESEEYGTAPKLMYSFQSLLHKLNQENGARLMLEASPYTYFLTALLLLFLIKRLEPDMFIAAVYLINVLISPHSFPQDSVILLIPVFVLLTKYIKKNNIVPLILLTSIEIIPMVLYYYKRVFIVPVFLTVVLIVTILMGKEVSSVKPAEAKVGSSLGKD